MTKTPEIPTSVGHADWGDNRFFGFRVLSDLAGRDGFWSAISLALGHRRLTREEEGILDVLSTCTIAGDPRIWPLKAVRLGASYGGTPSGICLGLLATSDALVGPSPAGHSAALLARIVRELGDDLEDDDALSKLVERYRAERVWLFGFGVVFREEDERVIALRRVLAGSGRLERPHFRLIERLDRILTPRKLRVNGISSIAAIALDLGFAPHQVAPLAIAILFSNFLANAVEGAAQAPACLQRLPEHCVQYAGKPARSSPRAESSSA